MLKVASLFLNTKLTPLTQMANSPPNHTSGKGIQLLIYQANQLFTVFGLAFLHSHFNIAPKPIIAYIELIRCEFIGRVCVTECGYEMKEGSAGGVREREATNVQYADLGASLSPALHQHLLHLLTNQ